MTHNRIRKGVNARFIRDELEEVPLEVRDNIWLQQDGAPPHFARVARAQVEAMFPGRWIGRGGPVPWPARCHDFSMLDFFAW